MKFLVRLAICFVLSATCVTSQNRPELPSELTLSQALRMALSNSTLLLTSQARLDEAIGQTEQSRAQLLPQLSLAARQSYYTASLIGLGLDIPTVPSKIGPTATMDARVILSENLLNVAQLKAWQSSRSRQGSSRFLVNNTRELVTLMVVTTYLEALEAKASRDSLVKQTQLARELYRITRDRVNQGVSAELDANREMQQVNTLEQQRQEFEQRYVAAKLELASILQARISADFEVSDATAYGDMLNLATYDRNAAIQTALTSRADYLSAEANVQAAQLNLESIKSSRLPMLRVLLSDGQSGSTPVERTVA